MTDMQFSNDRSYASRTVLGQNQTPGLVKWLLKRGIVKNESQAGYILIGIAVLCLAATVFFFMSMMPSPEVSYDESPHIQYENN